MQTKTRRRAFTLTEILVVLAVVGILAAILFPALSRVRASARTSTCSSNLRQIGQALSVYTSDNDGFYPPVITINSAIEQTGEGVKTVGTWWMNLHLQPVPICPDVDPDWRSDNPKLRHWISGYASNLNLTIKTGSPTKLRLSGQADYLLRFPSFTVTAFDARPLIYASRQPDLSPLLRDLNHTPHGLGYENDILQLSPGATRHQGGANYLFGDGHVKWMKPEALSTTRQNDGVHPGFGL